MPEIHIPITGGLDQSIDTKILPDGRLSALSDVRFRKMGKIGPRNGYTTGAGGSAAVASAEYSPGVTLLLQDRSSVSAVAPKVDILADSVGGVSDYTSLGFNSSLSTVGGVTRRPMAIGSTTGCMSSDVITTGTYLICVHSDGDVVGGTTDPRATPYMTIFDAGTLAYVSSNTPFSTASPAKNLKCVLVGTEILMFASNATTAIRIRGYAAGSLGTPPSSNISEATVATATSALASQYSHVAAYDASNGLLCFQSGATTMEWGYVSTAGVYTQKATWSVTNTVRPCICRVGNSSSDVAVIWTDGATFTTGTVSYAVWSSAGAVVTATTSLDAAGTASGYPMIAPVDVTGGVAMAWSKSASGLTTTTLRNAAGGAGGTLDVYGMTPAALPFALGNGFYIWMVDATQPNTGGAISLATYRLFDFFMKVAEGFGGVPQMGGAANLKALPGRYVMSVAAQNDTRRKVAAAVSQSPMPGCAGAVCVLPVLGADSVYSPQLVYVEQGTLAERSQTAALQGQLLFSGARPCVFDGSRFYQSGLFSGPTEVTAVNNGVVGSGIGAGTYQWCAVWERVDALGQRSYSAPSAPITLTVIANTQVVLTSNGPPPNATNGRPGLSPSGQDFYVRWFRTLNGGSIFYELPVYTGVAATTLVNVVPAATAGTVAIVFDATLDAVIADNSTLYTQGAQGGLSGILQNDEPPSAKFLAAGPDRFILGGLDEPNAVQLSKLIFPGEAVRWSASVAFRQFIDADVTAVAAQDGQWFVFSRQSVFAFTGEGPDDSGQGTWSAPVKLPAATGCISGRSILHTPLGVFFQGDAGIYIVPRGGGVPQWIGERIQDELASYPFVTATYFDQAAGVAYFACCNSGGTTGILLGYDTDHGEWFKDTVQNTVIVTITKFNGQLLLNGNVTQVAGAWKDNFTGAQDFAVGPIITTGDIRPFGVLGAGRTRKAVLLGELRSASNTTMLVEVSTDSGTTYTTIGTFTMAGTAGTAFRRECLLPRPRETAFRFRITMTPSASTVEAPIVNDITLEVFKSEGTSRLAAAERA